MNHVQRRRQEQHQQQKEQQQQQQQQKKYRHHHHHPDKLPYRPNDHPSVRYNEQQPQPQRRQQYRHPFVPALSPERGSHRDHHHIDNHRHVSRHHHQHHPDIDPDRARHDHYEGKDKQQEEHKKADGDVSSNTPIVSNKNENKKRHLRQGILIVGEKIEIENDVDHLTTHPHVVERNNEQQSKKRKIATKLFDCSSSQEKSSRHKNFICKCKQSCSCACLSSSSLDLLSEERSLSTRDDAVASTTLVVVVSNKDDDAAAVSPPTPILSTSPTVLQQDKERTSTSYDNLFKSMQLFLSATKNDSRDNVDIDVADTAANADYENADDVINDENIVTSGVNVNCPRTKEKENDGTNSAYSVNNSCSFLRQKQPKQRQQMTTFHDYDDGSLDEKLSSFKSGVCPPKKTKENLATVSGGASGGTSAGTAVNDDRNNQEAIDVVDLLDYDSGPDDYISDDGKQLSSSYHRDDDCADRETNGSIVDLTCDDVVDEVSDKKIPLLFPKINRHDDVSMNSHLIVDLTHDDDVEDGDDNDYEMKYNSNNKMHIENNENSPHMDRSHCDQKQERDSSYDCKTIGQPPNIKECAKKKKNGNVMISRTTTKRTELLDDTVIEDSLEYHRLLCPGKVVRCQNGTKGSWPGTVVRVIDDEWIVVKYLNNTSETLPITCVEPIITSDSNSRPVRLRKTPVEGRSMEEFRLKYEMKHTLTLTYKEAAELYRSINEEKQKQEQLNKIKAKTAKSKERNQGAVSKKHKRQK